MSSNSPQDNGLGGHQNGGDMLLVAEMRPERWNSQSDVGDGFERYTNVGHGEILQNCLTLM